MDLADAVSPSEKCGSEWLSSSSGSTRKRVLSGDGSGEWSKADMTSYGKVIARGRGGMCGPSRS